MRRVGWQMQVRKDKVEVYKEAHRNVWPEVLAALSKHGWHRYSIFMDENAMVFGYFETDADFDTALAGFMSEDVVGRWAESIGDLVDIPAGGDARDVIVELEEVFHLD
ncbi:MAG: L-rhamnose mutarotase [Candidatus Latescibacteria bacterium]|nr:L-rhamnose mutarotase [Candidatus Latescibacterota bacterium]